MKSTASPEASQGRNAMSHAPFSRDSTVRPGAPRPPFSRHNIKLTKAQNLTPENDHRLLQILTESRTMRKEITCPFGKEDAARRLLSRPRPGQRDPPLCAMRNP